LELLMKELYSSRDFGNYQIGFVILEREKSITYICWDSPDVGGFEFGEFDRIQVDTPANNQSFKYWEEAILKGDRKEGSAIGDEEYAMYYTKLAEGADWEHSLMREIW